MKLTSIVEQDSFRGNFRGNFKVDPEKNIRSTCLKSDFTRRCYPTIEILIVRLKTLTDENE